MDLDLSETPLDTLTPASASDYLLAMDLDLSALTAGLRETCAPVEHLCLSDVTDGHAVAGAKDGRAVRADGRDVQVLVVAGCFDGRSALERQQLVNGVLGAHVVSGLLHSVQLRCWTPAQWEKQGRPSSLGGPCTEDANSPTLAPLSGPSVGEALSLDSCTAQPSAPQTDAVPEPQPTPTTASPAASSATGEARPEPTVEMVVEHLRSQADSGLGSARAILACDRANDVAKRAAAIVAKELEAPAKAKVETCSVPGCMS